MCVCTSFGDTGAGPVCSSEHYRCKKSMECSAQNANVSENKEHELVELRCSLYRWTPD